MIQAQEKAFWEEVDMTKDTLRLALIEAQYALRASAGTPQGRSVLVLVSGVEVAGKGDSLTQLREWADPRLLRVMAAMPAVSPQQPLWLPYAPHLPAQGELVVMFSNWFNDLIALALQAHSPWHTEQVFAQIDRLRRFEQQLQANGTVLLKCWFELPWTVLQARLRQQDRSLQHWHRLHGLDWHSRKAFRRLQRLRHALGPDWVEIDGTEPASRDLAFARQVLEALQRTPEPAVAQLEYAPVALRPELLQPAVARLDKTAYKRHRARLQRRFAQLLRQYQQQGQRLVVVFEGMDAAGKGGAIRRVVAPLDPREYQIHSITAPNEVELAHDYLWRFRSRMPGAHQPGSGLVIFDRSWYGRVLVERVEGLVGAPDWQRAYAEINDFEADLQQHGVEVVKFWLAISPEEQARRFTARAQTPHKRFKITADDWHNRSRAQDYLQAASDLLARTSPPDCPWRVIATDDKYTARLQVLEQLCAVLEGHSGLPRD